MDHLGGSNGSRLTCVATHGSLRNRDGRLSRGCNGSSSRNSVLERGSIGSRQRSRNRNHRRPSSSPSLLFASSHPLFPLVPSFLGLPHRVCTVTGSNTRHALPMHALRGSILNIAHEFARTCSSEGSEEAKIGTRLMIVVGCWLQRDYRKRTGLTRFVEVRRCFRWFVVVLRER